MKIAKNLKILILITFLGFLFRVIDIKNNPPALFVDEMSIGFNAYKIATTGKDEHGKPLPIFFKASGEYKNPVPIYAVVPSVAIFGLNEFGIRLPTVIIGTLTIPLIYILGKLLFNQPIGLFASLFLAFSPWHIFLSRFGIDYIYTPFFILLGLIFFINSFKKPIFLPLSFLFLGLASYSSFVARVYVPIIFSVLLLIFLRKINKKYLLFSTFFLFLIILPHIQAMLKGTWFIRFNNTSIFTRTGVAWEIKIVFAALSTLNTLSPFFLFTTGETSWPNSRSVRQGLPNTGVLFLTQIPLLAIGIYQLLKMLRQKQKSFNKNLFLLLFLSIYPLGNFLSDYPVPHAGRLLFGVIPFSIISGLGLAKLLNRRLCRNFLVIFFVLELTFFTYKLFNFPKNKNTLYGIHGWDYGVKQTMEYIQQNNLISTYDEINMSHLFASDYFKFFTKDACEKCFPKGIESYQPKKKQLFILDEQQLMALNNKNNINILKTIYLPTGQPAYVILEVKNFFKTDKPDN